MIYVAMFLEMLFIRAKHSTQNHKDLKAIDQKTNIYIHAYIFLLLMLIFNVLRYIFNVLRYFVFFDNNGLLFGFNFYD